MNSNDRVKNINVQVSLDLANQIAEIANRDHNGISSTVRRLISTALAIEARQQNSGAGQ